MRRTSYIFLAIIILFLGAYFGTLHSAEAIKLRRLTRYATPVGARAVALGDNTLYAACGTNGVRYVRDATMIDRGFYFLGSYPTVDARDVYYDSVANILYVADGSAGIRVFQDDGSTLTQIAITNTPGMARKMVKSGSYLYVGDDTSGMQIVDITTPSHPILRGKGGTSGRAVDVAVNGSSAYVADGGQGLAMFDVSNPDNPTPQGSSFATGYAQGVALTVMGSQPLLFMASGGELRILNVAGPPSSLSLLDSIIAFDVDTYENFAFTAGGSSGLNAVQFSDPSAPRLAATLKAQGRALGVQVYERKLWVAVQTGGVDVIQIAWLPNDYNGDGVSDLAAYELSTGNWFIRSLGPVGPENPPITFGENWGGSGLTPVSGDFNGDSVADLAAYEQSTGGWFVKSMGGAAPMVFADIMGGPNFTAFWGDYIVGEFEGDTRCVYSSMNTQLIFKTTRTDPPSPVNIGVPNTQPVPGDYDGDGISDLAMYDPATGNWTIELYSGGRAVDGENWGGPGLVPVCGDFDGDTRFDMAVYELATGNWYIKSLWKTDPISFGQNWGGAGLYPVPGDFNGDGVWDLAAYQTSTGNWFIRSLGPVGPANPPISFGQNWGGPGLVPPGMVQ